MDNFRTAGDIAGMAEWAMSGAEYFSGKVKNEMKFSTSGLGFSRGRKATNSADSKTKITAIAADLGLIPEQRIVAASFSADGDFFF